MERLIALATRAKGGDRAALEDLLAESAGLVHAVARARLRNSLASPGATPYRPHPPASSVALNKTTQEIFRVIMICTPL